MKVLYVEDDFESQDAFQRCLGGAFDVSLALDASEGLRAMQNEGPFAVVVADLRMPGMDGVTFLAHVQASWASTTRVLLTGDPDLASAISAVNEGRIFRFLTKPCGTQTLLAAVRDAAEQHRVVMAEREVLEQTLLGTVKMLGDLLAVANPSAYGRASRVRNHIAALVTMSVSKTRAPLTSFAYGPRTGRPSAGAAGIGDRWEVEAAATLSQIGGVGLPAATAEKFYYGKPMSPAEMVAANRVPALSARLLANIPRLEGVRRILHYQTKNFDGSGIPAEAIAGESLPWGARALKIVTDFDVAESQGKSKAEALDLLRRKPDWYDRTIVELFGMVLGSARDQVQEVDASQIRAGMVFAEDVISKTGVLLAVRGLEVTQSILERIQTGWLGLISRPIKVVVKA